MLNRGKAIATLGASLLVVAALGVLGKGVEERLSPISLGVPGTPSARGQALAELYFDSSTPIVILLRGPAPQIDRQGKRLVAALRHDKEATTISAWDRGAIPELRPGPRRALVLVDFHVPLAEAMRRSVPDVEAQLQRHISSPVAATQSGFAAISRALQLESQRATERAEILAAPLLVLVLLLVFRSLVAAAVPLALGAMTVIAGRGILAMLSSLMTIDALSLVVCTMMGIALGVDYSLLIVSRFREELASGIAPREAARRCRASAGRTTAFAGMTLFVSIFISAFLQPGLLLVSLATALVVVTAISVALASFVLPAFLAMLGERINAVPIPLPFGGGGKSPRSRSRVAAAAGVALRRPAVAVALISLPLLLLAMPALAFNTGAPGVDELPTDSPARKDAEAINAMVGPGWASPFVLIAASDRGPITTPERLELLARWQRRIASRPDVKAVVGPSRINRSTAPLRRLGRSFASERESNLRGVTRLAPGIRRAGEAVAQLRDGVSRASYGSDALSVGAGHARHGARSIAGGVDRAASGGLRAGDAAGKLAEGSARLAQEQRKAAVAALTLALGLRSLLPSITGKGVEQARLLAAQLHRDAVENPGLQPEADKARALARALSASRAEVRRLRGTAIGLNGGLDKLANAGERLEAGARRLADSVPTLQSGLDRLTTGAQRLTAGLGRLERGAAQLRDRLADGYHRSARLPRGLERAGTRTSQVTAPLARASRLRQRSPRLFDSGYFVLSALDGAPRERRALAAEAINVTQGGQAARMLVISRHDFNTPGSRQMGRRLNGDAKLIEREAGLATGVTGGAAILEDYGSATRARLPLVIGTIVAITFLMLVAILRAPMLAGLTVCLNLATVAAAIGVMTLVSKIPAGYPLGGHPYIDTIGAASIFGVTFGLSIDYAVFLLARVKEQHDRGGDNRAAIAFGLERTAAVITGAAAIMSAVFVCFAVAPIATVGQMGLGLTVAILLDATIVRIVLLPALMLLLGERIWYVPPVLDRLLPNLNIGHSPLREA